MAVLEICVDSLESAVAAQQGGAQRIELCSSLAEGGLTPSLGLIRAVRSRLTIGIHVMIRPRAGDFLYSADEFSIMKDDIALAAQSGVDGVVFGLLTPEGEVDIARTRELVDLARPMEVTFHRAIDLSRDIVASVRNVIHAGVTRVLTSGGEASAVQGRHNIHNMVQAAAGAVTIMAGAGVRAANAEQLLRETGVRDLHASLRRAVPSPMKHHRRKVHLGAPGIEEDVRHVLLPEDVRALRQAILHATPDHRAAEPAQAAHTR